MKTLLIVEHDNQQLKAATLSAITAAMELQKPITALVAGYQCQAVAEQVSRFAGIHEVLQADHPTYAYFTAGSLSQLVAQLAPDYSYVLAPAGTFSRNFLPRTAALIDAAMLSDVVKILSADTFVRPIYASNALATVQCLDPIKIMTIRATAFNAAAQKDQAVPIKPINHVFLDTKTTFIDRLATTSERPELAAAEIVVAGGRGLQSAENFQLLEQIADQLGAAVGASRAAVDAGFAPNDYQVGQTGKVVAPKLYIAVGISGAIQHLAGMKESKVIVAINKDPDAAIFQIADYGLVADLFTVLPELAEALQKA